MDGTVLRNGVAAFRVIPYLTRQQFGFEDESI